MTVLRAVAVRILAAAATLVLALGIVFGFVSAASGDLAAAASGAEALSPEHRRALVAQLHLDLPPAERFVRWLSDAARGRLGVSFRDRRPVAEKISAAAGTSVAVNGAALVLMVLVSVPIGALAAWRPGSPGDRLLSASTFALHAVPVFGAAVILQACFAARLGWFPLFGTGTAAHLVLPVACLAYPGVAFLARFVRASLLEHATAEVARAARARGRSSLGAVVRHGFRQAAVPMLTLAGMLLPRLVGGAVLVEATFGLPGIGTLFADALVARDLPVVLGVTFVAGTATLAGIALADAAYAIADPRTRRAT
ncbi:MAG TPA: ABC transporter permease [Candidatus Polarisedimenticolaceae bacterium]